MPRPKGSTNKITTDVKEKLQSIVDEVINSIDVTSMDTSEKLKLLQLSLHYIVPKLRSVQTSNSENEDLPLFMEEIEI